MNDGVRKLAGGHWNTRYVGPDGKRYSRTFRAKQDATYWRSHELRLIDLDQWSPPASRNAKPATTSVLTVAEWTEQCVKARENRSRRPIRPTTADVYRKIARLTVNSSPLGAMPLKSVTRDDMSAWREALPARTRTQNGRACELLVSVFGDAVREGKIAASPATLRGAGTPERAREPKTMTAAEINAYLDAADPKWRVALLLSVTCALRIGETLGLRERDLDLAKGQLHVHQTVAKVDDGVGHRRVVLQDPKTRASQRTVHLLPHTLDELRVWHKKQPKRRLDDLLFPDEYGRPINDERLRRAHKKAAAAIGRPELRNHDLRATAATMSAEAGATVSDPRRRLRTLNDALTLFHEN